MTLPELLRSRDAFVLPATQRAYSWGELQVDRLFSDSGYMLLKGSTRVVPPDWLFLGTIYLADLKEDGTTAVADGQQRLVTGLMLHAGARDLETDPVIRAAYAAIVTSERDAVPRLKLRDIDAAFFKKWVLDDGAMLKPFHGDDSEADEASSPHVSESQSNILINRSLIIEKLKALTPADRRKFMDGIATATEVVVVTAPTVDDALNAYASTLRRGLRQADTDRLKFEVMGDAPPDKRQMLATHWDEAESRLGKEGLQDLCGVLLQNLTRTAPPADVLTGMMQAFKLPANAEPFIVETLAPSAEAFSHLLSRGQTLDKWLPSGITSRGRVKRIQSNVVALMRLSHEEWRGPAVTTLLKMREDLSALDETMTALERLAAVLMIVGVDPHALSQRYGELTAAIVSGNRDAIRAAADVDGELRARARDLLASAKFAEKPRYRAPVLLKLEDLASGDVSLRPVSDVSCEHVLPQNVTAANTTWRDAFRNPKNNAFNGHNYRHRLGNLTILSHADNRACADKAYDLKRPILAKSGFALSRQVASQHKIWTPAIVEARTQDLVQRLVQHWQL